MLLAEIVRTSEAVAATRSRLAKAGLLVEVLRRLDPEDIEIGVGFLAGALRQGRIGIGWDLLRDARAAPASSEASLTLAQTDAAFDTIAATTGKGSVFQRRRLLGALMARATAPEQAFVLRLVLGELRQGALEGLMADAIARAAGMQPGPVRRAIMLAGDVANVARAALTEGPTSLARFFLQPGKPVQPMLAQPAGDVAEALSALGEATFEYKLDGARVQIHKSGPDVRVFSRKLNDVTGRVPEIVEAVRALSVRQAILDGETIALEKSGRPLPFQVTMSRFGRRLEVDRARRELPLSLFVFDTLHLDGQDLLDLPGRERTRLLGEVLAPDLIVPSCVTSDPGTAERFLENALEKGHEGLMAKSPDAPYEAGRRGASWLKIKMAHTLDLAVLAAEWGNGRREGWLSNLHLGARDAHSGDFVMLGKTFKGMSDEMLAWQTGKLLTLEVRREGPVVFVRPELVVEIAFNNVQNSPHYPAGLALRFARVKRYRPDKSSSQADTIEAVREIHERQRADREGGRDTATGDRG